MNREIKFRAWESKSEKMIYSDNLDDDEFFLIDENGIHCGCIGEETDDTGFTYGVSIDLDCEIMQFTGLKDKNGREIYEFDIVKLNDIICPISWDDGGFHMITDKQQGKIHALQDILKHFEVIGNIYEDYELLND